MISIYCDGSSSGKSDKPGGWAWIIVVDGRDFRCGSGGEPKTTNNRMEMRAALEGLLYLKTRSGLHLEDHTIEVVSDSQVTLGLMSGKHTPSANTDLAVPLTELAAQLGARGRWVRGHCGDIHNERCDRLAKIAKKKIKES